MVRLNAPPLDLTLENCGLFLDGQEVRHQVRLLAEMAPVLEDESALRDLDKGSPAYFMYDDVYPETMEHGLRYDVTTLPPGRLGREYWKTMGHYHALLPGGGAYPEIYQVLSGEAIFLLQHRGEDEAVDEAVAVRAKEGDRLWIPPFWGHVSINPGEAPLVLCDLISPACQSDYSMYIEKRGAIYRALEDGTFQRNPHYAEEIQLYHCDAAETDTIERLTKDRALPQDMVEFLLSGEHILSRYLQDPHLFQPLTEATLE